MKLWLVLRSYGVGNLRNFLRNHVKMAKLFEELLRHDNRFEVVAPRNFALVCFRFLPWSNGGDNYDDVECANVLNQKLLESINGSGQVYMSPTVVDKVYIIRCAIGATLTEERHVIGAWKVVQEYADALLSKY
ncbi:tyrosine/dopa decarboxylase 5 [Fagus crenata]